MCGPAVVKSLLFAAEAAHMPTLSGGMGGTLCSLTAAMIACGKAETSKRSQHKTLLNGLLCP
jgi:hypothetical protein